MYSYFLIIAICLTIFGVAYTYFTYRNKERLALLESGLDMDFFKKNLQRQNIFLLSFGMVLIGFSIGVLTGFFFEKYLLANYNPNEYRNYPQAYIVLVSLFMGIAMLISFFINRRLNRR
jgi:membrane protease YdiL (CAAX protease family)